MTLSGHHHVVLVLCLLAAGPLLSAAQSISAVSKFDICKTRVQEILSGTLEWKGINNATIGEYQYFGAVRGMNPDYSDSNRTSFLTLTTQGCRTLCEDPTDFYWTSNVALTLGIIANWILPILALLAALPYDSHHGRVVRAPIHQSRVLKTLGALNNWVGSPQTAMATTLFNIHQMRLCVRETFPVGSGISGDDGLSSIKRDAYYVLSCVNQFRLPRHDDAEFMNALTYGLFRPMVARDAAEPDRGNARAREWTEQLVREMAFHLRMLRRRGVYPALLSVFLFCVAYAVSVVMAFAEIGERTTAHALAFGILVSWLPLLVLFAIIDRNPVSADRSRKLVARWLWNADAVSRWERIYAGNPNAPPPEWWSQKRQNETPRHRTNAGEPMPFDRFIGEFCGQGRQIGYSGLAHAVMSGVYDGHGIDRRMHSTREIARQARAHLRAHRPGSWWILSLTTLAIVWLEIGMAVMLSFNTPTVGLACRSGSYLIFGLLSTVPWVLHCLPSFQRPGIWKKTVCHAFSLLSNLAMMLIIFAAFSGLYNNCTCKSGFTGYMDFENADFYLNKKHFDVSSWWVAAAVVGALPTMLSLTCVLVWPGLLSKLKPFWRASEHRNPPEVMSADTMWLI